MIITIPSTQPFLQADSDFAAASPSNTHHALESDRELQLATVIQTVHQLSQSGKYHTDQVLPLLDFAWEAQKLLWHLRQNH